MRTPSIYHEYIRWKLYSNYKFIDFRLTDAHQVMTMMKIPLILHIPLLREMQELQIINIGHDKVQLIERYKPTKDFKVLYRSRRNIIFA